MEPPAMNMEGIAPLVVFHPFCFCYPFQLGEVTSWYKTINKSYIRGNIIWKINSNVWISFKPSLFCTEKLSRGIDLPIKPQNVIHTSILWQERGQIRQRYQGFQALSFAAGIGRARFLLPGIREGSVRFQLPASYQQSAGGRRISWPSWLPVWNIL